MLITLQLFTMAKNQADRDPISFKVFEEKANVDKAVVEKGAVKISKKVHNDEVPVNVTVRSEEVNVERVPVNKYVDKAPEIRYDGNTTIIPVIKEVAVVETKIMLVEEVHLTRKIHTKDETRHVSLRKEKVIIDSTRDQ